MLRLIREWAYSVRYCNVYASTPCSPQLERRRSHSPTVHVCTFGRSCAWWCFVQGCPPSQARELVRACLSQAAPACHPARKRSHRNAGQRRQAARVLCSLSEHHSQASVRLIGAHLTQKGGSIHLVLCVLAAVLLSLATPRLHLRRLRRRWLALRHRH